MNIFKLFRRPWCHHNGMGVGTYIPKGRYVYKGSRKAYKLLYTIRYEWVCGRCGKHMSYKIRSGLNQQQMEGYMNYTDKLNR